MPAFNGFFFSFLIMMMSVQVGYNRFFYYYLFFNFKNLRIVSVNHKVRHGALGFLMNVKQRNDGKGERRPLLESNKVPMPYIYIYFFIKGCKKFGCFEITLFSWRPNAVGIENNKIHF